MSNKLPPPSQITLISNAISADPNITKGPTERETIIEYVKKLFEIENEINVLKEDQKTLKEDYKDKLDMKAVAQVLRTVKILQKVESRSTYDNLLDIIEKDLNLLPE